MQRFKQLDNSASLDDLAPGHTVACGTRSLTGQGSRRWAFDPGKPKDPGWSCPPTRERTRRPSVEAPHLSRMRRHSRRGNPSHFSATLILRTNSPTMPVPVAGRADYHSQTHTLTVYLTPKARNIIQRRHTVTAAAASESSTQLSQLPTSLLISTAETQTVSNHTTSDTESATSPPRDESTRNCKLPASSPTHGDTAPDFNRQPTTEQLSGPPDGGSMASAQTQLPSVTSFAATAERYALIYRRLADQ